MLFRRSVCYAVDNFNFLEAFVSFKSLARRDRSGPAFWRDIGSSKSSACGLILERIVNNF
ncbi:hypothetical protein APHMUC_0078 [Anaplasma phagocytophilum str. ApMUC09]|uniref:Uncharacterized protein n=1 Tax=Anaplasma phagocytophilum str. ApMUC09 TaxID=1359152 RepID=A0A0F3N8D7_ANAPH|nr:hypothetical protein APHMUC_0078 [Anaplasma phagocytophilum str. ApMUC09]